MTTDDAITGSAPGKVIISGEHSVVYGKPALVMETRSRASATIRPSAQATIDFDVPNLDYTLTYSGAELKALYLTLTQRYAAFSRGESSIKDVLGHPVDLIPFAFATIWKRCGWHVFRPCTVSLDITIPIGCGMGSSAAVGLSVITAAMRYFGLDLSESELYEESMACERLMHGNPSGVDSSVAVYGGTFRFHNNERHPRLTPSWPLRFINTGRPAVSTGECVESVKASFSESDSLWSEFERVTDGIDGLLESRLCTEVLDLIMENHELLTQIGVVPKRVGSIVSDIEACGGAAKVCGAGATKGDAAGIIMVAGDCDIDAVLEKWNLKLVEQY